MQLRLLPIIAIPAIVFAANDTGIPAGAAIAEGQNNDLPNNYFLTPAANDRVPAGQDLKVYFKTNYTKPYMSLFCSNLEKPLIAEYATAPEHTLDLDNVAAQPNCYIQVQDGEGPPNAKPSFGTGIFALEGDVDAAFKGDDDDDKNCHCPCPRIMNSGKIHWNTINFGISFMKEKRGLEAGSKSEEST